jgi:hypothetical protein
MGGSMKGAYMRGRRDKNNEHLDIGTKKSIKLRRGYERNGRV